MVRVGEEWEGQGVLLRKLVVGDLIIGADPEYRAACSFKFGQ